MQYVISFLQNKLVGLPYIITVVVAIFLIFAIIGYLLDLKINKK